MNTTTQQDTQAAANKAAEEGELSMADESGPFYELFKFTVGSLAVHNFVEAREIGEKFRALIAAYRASRQVANKAEVEPVFYARQFDLDDPKWAAKHGVFVFGEKQEEGGAGGWTVPLYATPPATTGCAEARHSGAMPKDLAIQCLNALDVDSEAHAALSKFIIEGGAVGVSKESVLSSLTDERIDALWEEAFGHESFKRGFARAIAREVAAQAGQVAMPEWISVDDRLPPNEELPNGDWPSVLALWKEGALADGLVDQMVTNTAYFCKNLQNFTHWMPLPAAPSPAKESK